MKAFNWFLEYGVFFASTTMDEGHRGKKRVNSLPLASLWQMHSSNIIHARDPGIYEGDGLITSQKRLYLGIVSADCLPILFFDPVQREIALLHAGWKGLYNDFSLVVLKEHFAKNLSNLMVGIGPHICAAHYEVENPIQQSVPAWRPFLNASAKRGSFFLDLEGYCKQTLLERGVKENNIFSTTLCTFEEAGQQGFFSRRRGDEDNVMIVAALLAA